MNEISPKLISFDRFVLDLSRGCVRGPDRDIELRPKAFEVLRYLVANAGRLISKHELSEAAWPSVSVSDDSLVQCIRELRDKLGDGERTLIKTVPRRGYLLDTTTTPVLETRNVPAELNDTRNVTAELADTTPAAAPKSARLRYRWSVAAALACAAIASVYFIASPHAWLANSLGTAERKLAAGQAYPSFKDCDVCTDMIALPAGRFMMGSPLTDGNRGQVEGVPRLVTISRPFAIGKYEVTVSQFNAFLAETGSEVSNLCRLIDGVEGNSVSWGAATASFRQPGYEVSGAHPVDCVSWHDAEAFAAWLRRRTGKPYRLPTEAEWEYAARAGTATAFSFGNDTTRLCDYARFADLASSFPWRGGCRGESEKFGPLPVGQLKPNAWGLYDMHGNVWEWVQDCWTPNPQEIPADASAVVRSGSCELGSIRGGSFASGYQRVRSAYRFGIAATRRDQNTGFRVALSLEH